MVHDASTGFHDIKPLPLFSPLPLREMLAAAFILASIALIAWYFNRARKADHTGPVVVPLTPYEKAQKEFAALEQHVHGSTMQLRDIGTRASLVLRAYFGAVFGFPAKEQTNKEFLAALRRATNATPHLRDDLLRRFESILRFCELLTFSDQTEARYAQDRSELVKRLTDARMLIEEDHARRRAAQLEQAALGSSEKGAVDKRAAADPEGSHAA